MRRYHLLTTIYLAVWSILIGIATGLYLNAINFVIELFWHHLPTWLGIPGPWRAVAICLPGGLLIGIVQKYLGPAPLTIAEVLNEVQQTGHFSYHRWWKILVAGLLILGAGASAGPEASTSGLVAGMIYWLGRRYKLIRDQAGAYAHQSFWAQNRAIWGTRLAQGGPTKPLTAYFTSPQQQKRFYWCWTLVALGGFFGYFHFFPQEGVIGFHHPALTWQWQGSLVVIPAVITGWGFGFIFVKVSKFSERWLGHPEHPIGKACLGGALLALTACFSSDILFSGEFRIVPFAHQAFNLAPGYLISLACLKLIITNVGFSLGWRGGTIFPAIFSSLAIGAALAQCFPWMPQLTACLVVAVAVTVILEKPLISAAVLILLLPVQFSLLIIGACWFTTHITQRFPLLKP